MIINAKVRTRQKEFSISKKGDQWTIYVTSPPEANKANMEIVKNLSKIYSSVRIVTGLKSSKKIIEIIQ